MFLLAVFLWALSLSDVPVDDAEIYVSPNRARFAIRVDGDSYYVKEGEGWVLIEGGLMPGGDSAPVVFLGGKLREKYVFLKIYEGRVEGYYSLYRLDVDDGKTKVARLPGVFGAPTLDEQGFLISTTHDGPFAKVEKYSIGEGVRKVQSIIPIDSDLQRVSFYKNEEAVTVRVEFLGADVEACMVVVAENAHISKEPKVNGDVKPYLIQGDVAVILDVSEDKLWMRTQYGEKKTTRGWVSAAKVRIGDIKICKDRVRR